MSVQTNPRGVTSIESFLSGFLGMTAEQFAHRFGECKTIGVEDSAIFSNAAEKNSRYQYLQHYLNTGRKTEQEKERAAAYLLENTCV